MAGAPFAIKIDEFKPEPSPGPSIPVSTVTAASAAAAYARKSERACDFCRRRKTRCDGAPTPGSKCSNCRRNQCPCTYQEASRPRGPPKAYVTSLEDRVERFERLFKRLRPDVDLTSILGPSIPRDSWKNDKLETKASTPKDASPGPSKSITTSPTNKAFYSLRGSPFESDWSECESDEEYGFYELPTVRLPVQGPTVQKTGRHHKQDSTNLGDEREHSIRYVGKSSPSNLVRATREQKRDALGTDGFYDLTKDDNVPLGNVLCTGITDVPKNRRSVYWSILPWEKAWSEKQLSLACRTQGEAATSSGRASGRLHEFPPADLVYPLLALYFHHQNTVFPLFHAPTFYAQLHDGLHTRCAHFAGVVWAALAVASRWSEDRRVLWDGWGAPPDMTGQTGEAHEDDWGSAGWRFFLRSSEGPSFTVTSFDSPSLFDLQFCTLAAMFLRGSSVHPSGWVIVGSGIRKAMDVGAHRKRVYSQATTVENELWKRAFWMLVVFDRIGSVATGRPICAREEDIDVELPLEVDDDFWIPADPSLPAFVQPEGKPSSITGLVCMLKLNQIIAQTLRTIYCIDQSKVLLGLESDDWQEQILSQLNTALDDWVASVPNHLRWRADMEDSLFANQSAVIYGTYYLTLILIYRPFSKMAMYLPPDGTTASATFQRLKRPFPFPADSICMTAAHSAVCVLEAQAKSGSANVPFLMNAAHVSAATLLMGLHSQAIPASKDAKGRSQIIEDVKKCIAYLRLTESRWVMSRRYVESFEACLPSEGSMEQSSDQSLSGTPFQFPEMNFGLSQKTTTFTSIRPDLPLNLTPRPILNNNGPAPTQMQVSNLSNAEALQSRADWRWFHDHPVGANTGTNVHHHVPHPLASTTSTPSSEQEDILAGWDGTVRTGPGHAVSGLRDEPISTRGRVARSYSVKKPRTGSGDGPATGSALQIDSRSFLMNVASSQSAARDEPSSVATATGNWQSNHLQPHVQSQMPIVRMPQVPPYFVAHPHEQQQQQQVPMARTTAPLRTSSYTRGR